MQLLIREKEKAFPAIIAKIYDQAMVAEREAHLGAGPYERALMLAAVEKYAGGQSMLSAWMLDNISEGLTVFSFPNT